MEIGIDASRLAVGQRTGTENYAYQIVRALAALDQHNRYTLYFNQPPVGAEALLAALPNRWRTRNLPARRLWTHLRLSREMATAAPRVLFVPAHVVPAIHPRTVVTLHDLGYLRYPEAHSRLSRYYLRLSTIWSARAARQIIAVSAATARDVVQHSGVSAAKVRVVYHGYDDARFVPVVDEAAIAAAKVRLGLQATESYVLYVGTIQPRKNLTRLVEAFAASGCAGDYRLVLGGKRGWLSDEIYATASRLGLQNRVLFPGYLNDDDLPALYSGATLFAFPSLYEGFGLPVLEAMAAGTPVLAANASSLPEIVGDAAVQCDPQDTASIAAALHWALSDANLRSSLRQRGLQQAQQFSWRRCATETLAVLEEVGSGQ